MALNVGKFSMYAFGMLVKLQYAYAFMTDIVGRMNWLLKQSTDKTIQIKHNAMLMQSTI